jgi:hypothetical protein
MGKIMYISVLMILMTMMLPCMKSEASFQDLYKSTDYINKNELPENISNQIYILYNTMT